MPERIATEPQLPELRFSAYGVPIVVTAPSEELLSHVEGVMPPGWVPRDEETDAERRFGLTTRDNVVYRVQHPDGSVPGSSDLEVALDVLGAQLRMCIAVEAPDRVFVHAGAVGHAGRAIVIPGKSFTGKSSLVAALVRAGAVYYSDEYAVLDDEGRVHPYAKRLSLRTGSLQTRIHTAEHDVSALGGVAGEVSLPIGMVISTVYHPGATWNPQRVSRGQGVMAMLANTVVAQERPEQSMAALTHALAHAVVLEGERGEASEIASRILEMVESLDTAA